MITLNLEDQARLEYSRLLWKKPRTRRRLLYVWEHPDHPHRERFEENRDLIVGFLECENPDIYVDSVAGSDKWSLRTLTREIPCIIWEFWDESKEAVAESKEEVRGSFDKLRTGSDHCYFKKL